MNNSPESPSTLTRRGYQMYDTKCLLRTFIEIIF